MAWRLPKRYTSDWIIVFKRQYDVLKDLQSYLIQINIHFGDIIDQVNEVMRQVSSGFEQRAKHLNEKDRMDVVFDICKKVLNLYQKVFMKIFQQEQNKREEQTRKIIDSRYLFFMSMPKIFDCINPSATEFKLILDKFYEEEQTKNISKSIAIATEAAVAAIVKSFAISWSRTRHFEFSTNTNKLFATFFLAIQRLEETAGLPLADQAMLEETLECFTMF